MVRGVVPLSAIKLFERVNNISVNVYSFCDKDKVVIPVKVNKVQQEKHLNLCLFDDHYHSITKFESFLYGQRTIHFAVQGVFITLKHVQTLIFIWNHAIDWTRNV